MSPSSFSLSTSGEGLPPYTKHPSRSSQMNGSGASWCLTDSDGSYCHFRCSGSDGGDASGAEC